MTLETEPRRRRGGARGNPQAGHGGPLQQLAPCKLQRHFTPTAIISDDEVESIHRTSLQTLAEVGMDFMHDEARALWKNARVRHQFWRPPFSTMRGLHHA